MDEGEAFMKLWFVPPSSEFSPYMQEEKKFIEESYVFRSFRSEFEVDKCFTKNCLKAVKDAEDKNSYSSATRFEDFIPGYSALSYLPKKSILTRQEMNDCYEIVLLLSNFKSLTLEQQQKINFYKEKMTSEQKEYLGLAKSQWMRENYSRHKEIMPEVEKFINKLWQLKLDRVKTYPKFYSQSCLINLCPNSEDPIEFNFCGQIRRIGKLPRLFLPNLRFIRLNVNNCCEKISMARLEGKAEMNKVLGKNHGYHAEVSKDKVAEEVALSNNANVVMSASAFLALVDNHRPDFLATWDLPVTVKEYNSDTGGKHKVIFIDKKFPPRSLNQNERKSWYCKIACDNRVRSMTGVKRCRKAAEWDNPEEENVTMEEHIETSSDLYNTRDEEFTSSDPEAGTIGFQYMQIAPSICSISDTDSDVNSLTIDMDDVGSDNNDSKPQHPLNQSANRYNDGSDLECKMETNKSGKTRKHYESISYNLWRLHKVTSSYLSKNVSKVLGIVIRCKEGHLKVKEGENKKKIRELYKVTSKMEYQPEYGAEQVSLSELTRQWASLLIRPNTHLARMRVNPLDGEVIMYDKMNLSNLACEGQRLFGVNLRECLSSFHSVVEKLTELPAGQYYISHKPVNSAFAPLFKATNGTYELSLNSSFNVNTNEVAPERASWNPLDVNIINPTFKHFHRVPAMFTPCKIFSRPDSQSKNQASNKSNNKRSRRCRKNKFKNR